MKRVSAAVLAGSLVVAPHLLAEQHLPVFSHDQPILAHSQGYLGVDVRDIGTARASQLHLKSTRGAEIVTVDHDAPAARAGLRIHDVILEMNGQIIEGEAQMSHMMRQMPAGRVITLVISRDGQQKTLSVRLANKATIEAEAWSKHIPVPEPPNYGSNFALPSSGSPFGNGFLSGSAGHALYTGLDLDVLGPQLAGYFGIHNGKGLLVRHVDSDSPASTAGLRAGDVIVRANGKVVATPAQLEHVLHANRGKPVHLSVFRNRQEQTLTMTVGQPKTSSFLSRPAMSPGWSPVLLARSMGHELARVPAGALQHLGNLEREIRSLPGRSLP